MLHHNKKASEKKRKSTLLETERLRQDIEELEDALLLHTRYQADRDNSIRGMIRKELGTSYWEHGGEGKLITYKSGRDLIGQGKNKHGLDHQKVYNIKKQETVLDIKVTQTEMSKGGKENLTTGKDAVTFKKTSKKTKTSAVKKVMKEVTSFKDIECDLKVTSIQAASSKTPLNKVQNIKEVNHGVVVKKKGLKDDYFYSKHELSETTKARHNTTVGEFNKKMKNINTSSHTMLDSLKMLENDKLEDEALLKMNNEKKYVSLFLPEPRSETNDLFMSPFSFPHTNNSNSDGEINAKLFESTGTLNTSFLKSFDPEEHTISNKIKLTSEDGQILFGSEYSKIKRDFKISCDPEVESWLHNLGLQFVENFIHIFCEHQMDMTKVKLLTASDLRRMGINDLGPIMRIMKGVQVLERGQGIHPQSGKSGDLSLPQNGKSDDVSLSQNGKSRDLSLPQNGKPRDVSLLKNGKSSDLSIQQNGKSSDMSLQQNGKHSNVPHTHIGKSCDVLQQNSGKPSDVLQQNCGKSRDMSLHNNSKSSDMSLQQGDQPTSLGYNEKSNEVSLKHNEILQQHNGKTQKGSHKHSSKSNEVSLQDNDQTCNSFFQLNGQVSEDLLHYKAKSSMETYKIKKACDQKAANLAISSIKYQVDLGNRPCSKDKTHKVSGLDPVKTVHHNPSQASSIKENHCQDSDLVRIKSTSKAKADLLNETFQEGTQEKQNEVQNNMSFLATKEEIKQCTRKRQPKSTRPTSSLINVKRSRSRDDEKSPAYVTATDDGLSLRLTAKKIDLKQQSPFLRIDPGTRTAWKQKQDILKCMEKISGKIKWNTSAEAGAGKENAAFSVNLIHANCISNQCNGTHLPVKYTEKRSGTKDIELISLSSEDEYEQKCNDNENAAISSYCQVKINQENSQIFTNKIVSSVNITASSPTNFLCSLEKDFPKREKCETIEDFHDSNRPYRKPCISECKSQGSTFFEKLHPLHHSSDRHMPLKESSQTNNLKLIDSEILWAHKYTNCKLIDKAIPKSTGRSATVSNDSKDFLLDCSGKSTDCQEVVNGTRRSRSDLLLASKEDNTYKPSFHEKDYQARHRTIIWSSELNTDITNKDQSYIQNSSHVTKSLPSQGLEMEPENIALKPPNATYSSSDWMLKEMHNSSRKGSSMKYHVYNESSEDDVDCKNSHINKTNTVNSSTKLQHKTLLEQVLVSLVSFETDKTNPWTFGSSHLSEKSSPQGRDKSLGIYDNVTQYRRMNITGDSKSINQNEIGINQNANSEKKSVSVSDAEVSAVQESQISTVCVSESPTALDAQKLLVVNENLLTNESTKGDIVTEPKNAAQNMYLLSIGNDFIGKDITHAANAKPTEVDELREMPKTSIDNQQQEIYKSCSVTERLSIVHVSDSHKSDSYFHKSEFKSHNSDSDSTESDSESSIPDDISVDSLERGDKATFHGAKEILPKLSHLKQFSSTEVGSQSLYHVNTTLKTKKSMINNLATNKTAVTISDRSSKTKENELLKFSKHNEIHSVFRTNTEDFFIPQVSSDELEPFKSSEIYCPRSSNATQALPEISQSEQRRYTTLEQAEGLDRSSTMKNSSTCNTTNNHYISNLQKDALPICAPKFDMPIDTINKRLHVKTSQEPPCPERLLSDYIDSKMNQPEQKETITLTENPSSITRYPASTSQLSSTLVDSNNRFPLSHKKTIAFENSNLASDKSKKLKTETSFLHNSGQMLNAAEKSIRFSVEAGLLVAQRKLLKSVTQTEPVPSKTTLEEGSYPDVNNMLKKAMAERRFAMGDTVESQDLNSDTSWSVQD